MGRLPAKFAGKDITFRIPFSLPAELTVASNTQGAAFPDSSLLINSDKPFEIHRMIVRLTALTGAENPVIVRPQPDDLGKFVRLRIQDVSKNENLTKAAHLVDTLQIGSTAPSWEWDDPYTLVRSEGFAVTVDTQALGTVCAPDANCDLVQTTIDFVRVEISLQGFLIVIAPPSEIR